MNLTLKQFDALRDWVEAVAWKKTAEHLAGKHGCGRYLTDGAAVAASMAENKALSLLCGHASFTDAFFPGDDANDE